MEDTTVSIIGIIIASILMFIVPLVTIADRNDDIAQLTVNTLTAEFVDNVIKLGKITAQDYQNYILRLGTTRNTYEIDIELKILDENPSKRVTDANGTVIGENAYYSLYTTQVEDELQKSEQMTGIGQIILKEGDVISVTTKNSSKTLSQTLKSIYYTITGEDLHIIASSSSGTIALNGAT